MKSKNVTVFLPQELVDFAKKKSKEIAAKRCERPNLSGFFKDLLLEEKSKEEEAAKISKAA